MKKHFTLFIFLISISLVTGASSEYDAIIVRSDLPYDWTVAQAYSQRVKIPIIATSPDFLDPATRDQLLGFKESGHGNVLVLGGEAAISPVVEEELVVDGFVTHRIREVDRYGTSARVAVELYGQMDAVVIVNGEDVYGLLNSQMAALQTGSPILFVKKDEIPRSVREAMRALGTKEVVLIPSGISDGVKSELEAEYSVRVFPEGVELDNGLERLRVMDIAVGLALGVIISILIRRRKKVRVPYNVLTEDEERVIKAIEESGGEMGQDELYDATGFSRPKISRIVSELVERDLVEKTQFKRTFKLKIKKELFKG